jgi:hypothetical protein
LGGGKIKNIIKNMKQKMIFLTLALFMLSAASVNAQVLIGGNGNQEPHSGTILDLRNTDTSKGGLLLPRVALTNMASLDDISGDNKNAEALIGLTVYNTIPVTEGIYVWDGTKWNKMAVCPGPAVAALTAPTVCSGNNLAMTANVIADNGSAITGYEWKLGGTVIGTSADLNYTVTTADNGKILTLSVTNTCGAAVTEGVMVTIPGTFTQNDPEAVTICNGAAHTFTLAEATGGLGAITYQWEQSSNNSNWTNAAGTNNTANYTTPALTTTMYYRRQATVAS